MTSSRKWAERQKRGEDRGPESNTESGSDPETGWGGGVKERLCGKAADSPLFFQPGRPPLIQPIQGWLTASRPSAR